MKRSKKKEQPVQLAISEEEFLTPFEAIHRDESAFIGFARKTGESKTGIENLFSLTRKEVRAMLPTLAQYLLEDSYMTVNGYARRPTWNTNKKIGLPGVWRMEKNLRCLNAVYADLDIGRAGEAGPRGMSVNDANQLLVDLVFERPGSNIPVVSLMAQSGRGLYVFWILRDDDDESAPVTFKGQKNYVETVALYKAVNRAIYKRLECLAADRLCDAARILRVPGTRHSTTGELCKYRPGYTIDSNGDSRLITYTLKELAAWFGVPVMAKSLPGNLRQWQANENPISPQKANGPKSLAAARARDLVTLEQWRGGWKKGNRRFTLRLYAHFLKSAGTPKVETEAAVSIMASQCQPPYPSDTTDQPISAILREVWLEPFATYTQQNLVKWLQVSADEARELELEKIVPIEVQDERRIPRGGLRAQEKSQRRAVIQQIIEEAGMQSVRDFVPQLEARNVRASAATIQRDLVALGYEETDTRKKAGRPANQPALFNE
jgi:hypothetical protein